jgi:hypothetical protein
MLKTSELPLEVVETIASSWGFHELLARSYLARGLGRGEAGQVGKRFTGRLVAGKG